MTENDKDAPASAADAEDFDAEKVFEELTGGAAPDAPSDEGREDEDPASAPADDPPAPEEAGDDKDIWADAPDVYRAAHEAARAELDRLKHETQTNKGRLSAQDRELARLRDALAAAPAPEAGDEDEDDLDEGLASVEDDYPEITGPIIKGMSRLQDQVDAMAAVQAGHSGEREAAQESVLSAAHPDWRNVFQEHGDAFNAWIDDQPRADRDAYAANRDAFTDVAAFVPVMARFKQHIGAESSAEPSADGGQKTDRRRERQLQAAADPNTRGRPVTSAAPGDDASEEALFNYWVDQAARKKA